jgi:hypothetical protein
MCVCVRARASVMVLTEHLELWVLRRGVERGMCRDSIRPILMGFKKPSVPQIFIWSAKYTGFSPV